MSHFSEYGNSDKATVMKYDGSSWVNVGSAGFSAGGAGYISLAIDSNNTPYVAYQDNGNGDKATVMKYTGSGATGWEYVGSAGFSTGTADFISFAIAPNNTPYIAFLDGSNDKGTVMKYNGGGWVNVGSAGFFSPLETNYYILTIEVDSNNTPYIGILMLIPLN